MLVQRMLEIIALEDISMVGNRTRDSSDKVPPSMGSGNRDIIFLSIATAQCAGTTHTIYNGFSRA